MYLDFFAAGVYNLHIKEMRYLLMYNEKIKNEYLSGLSAAAAKSQRSYFAKIEDYEKKLQKDVVFFSREEFSELIKNIKGLSVGKSMYNFVGCLKSYGKWYNDNYSPIDYRSVFSVNYTEILPFYYKSSEELISEIDSVIRSIISEYGISLEIINGYMKELRMTYNVAIGVILLSWCGLTIEEIINLKSDDVFTEGNVIYVEDRKTLVTVDEPIMYILSQIKIVDSYAKIDKKSDNCQLQDEYIISTEKFHYTQYFLKKRGKSANYSNSVSSKLIDLCMREFNNNSKESAFVFISMRENGMFCRAHEKSKSIIDLQFKDGNSDRFYYALFDDWAKKISKNRFDDLKYKYRAFVKLVEGKENR